MTDTTPSILIATCGNTMAADDAFGPEVAGRLRGRDLPGVEVVDLDIKPIALLDHLAGREVLILVDAVQTPGDEAGTLIDVDFAGDDRPKLAHDDALSSHGLSIANQVEFARQLNLLPPVVRLIGVTLATAELGAAMSDAVTASLPAAVDRIVEWVEKFNHQAATETGHA